MKPSRHGWMRGAVAALALALPALASAAERSAVSVPASAWVPVADPGGRTVAQCEAYAQQRQFNKLERLTFTSNCPGGKGPMEDLERRVRATSARMGAQDSAEYPTSRVQTDVRAGCTANNQSGVLVLDCACMAREADRHLAEQRLSRRAVAQQQFDPAPCIERKATADKWVVQQFQPGTVNMLRSAGINVDAQRACTHRAIAQDMPRESLNNFGLVRSELEQRCPAVRR